MSYETKRGTVASVELKMEHRAEYYLNRITFNLFAGGLYVAFEKSTDGTTMFKEKEDCYFEITHPAKGDGKKDWIRYFGPYTTSFRLNERECLSISERSVGHAIEFMKVGDLADGAVDMDSVKSLSRQIADIIIKQASDIYQAQTG